MPIHRKPELNETPRSRHANRVTIVLKATWTAVLSAAVILGVVAVARIARLRSRRAAPGVATAAQWRAIEANAHVLGSPTARVKIVEFADFECFACAQMERTLAQLRSKYPDDVSVLFLHYPIGELHPYAWAAALASECASDQHRFGAYHDILMANQPSLGTRSWAWYAKEAGVCVL